MVCQVSTCGSRERRGGRCLTYKGTRVFERHTGKNLRRWLRSSLEDTHTLQAETWPVPMAKGFKVGRVLSFALNVIHELRVLQTRLSAVGGCLSQGTPQVGALGGGSETSHQTY